MKRPTQNPPEVLDHEWRLLGIGGSDAPAVMNASPWCNPQKLWELKTGRRAPDPQNYPMKRGLRMEPIARKSYELETGILMPSDRAVHPELDFVRAHFDGANWEILKLLEIKCPGIVDHLMAVEGKIPEKYIWQCVHLLLVTGLDHLDYYSFDGKEGKIVPFERNPILEEQLLERETKFWEFVKRDSPPSETFMKEKPKLHLVTANSSDPFKIRKSRPITAKQAQSILNKRKAVKAAQAIEKEKLMDTSENGKRQTPTRGAYSAREVVEILERAKELGVVQMRLEGFEATFEPQMMGAVSQPRRDGQEPTCECGAPKPMGRFGPLPLCADCFQRSNVSRRPAPSGYSPRRRY